MPAFQYEAIKISDKSRVNGMINADTERQAREMLRAQDLMPTKLKTLQSDKAKVLGPNPIARFMERFRGVGIKDQIAFTRNMALMIRAGIPVTEGLLYLENYAENLQFRRIVKRIRRDILTGYSFSQALAKHRKIFSDVYVNVARAGETSGELERAMDRLTDLLEKSQKLKMKIVSASVYPMVVVGIVIIVLLLMFLLVLPTFKEIYQQMGVELPMLTVIMMGISDFLLNYWFIAFPALGLSAFGLFKYITSAGGKTILDIILIRVPVVGELIVYINNSHFISTFAVSFGAGLPITDAIFLAAQTVRHQQMRQAFQTVNAQIQAGQRLAISLSQTGYLPDIVLLMISTGEESGELDKMLETSFEYLEDEINHRVEIMMSMMEPIMLLVLGVLVCLIALSVYMPMFSMYEGI